MRPACQPRRFPSAGYTRLHRLPESWRAGVGRKALDAYGRITGRPSFYNAYVAACHAELGQMDEARKHADLALQARPDFSVSGHGKKLSYKNEADLKSFLDGMRKAGLPE